MKDATKYIGLDVSKEKIAVAIAEDGREPARYYGLIPHTKEAVRKLIDRLSGENIVLDACYEAGPTGYDLYRWLLELNVDCTVVAPSLIPQLAGNKVKTDKRDALRLAQLWRARELTAVYVPTPEDEAFRDLVRAREAATHDLNRHKQRLSKFLLRHQIHMPAGMKSWTLNHERWLDTLRFSNDCETMVFQEYRRTISETQERIKRYTGEIENQAATCSLSPIIHNLQALRGIATLTASTLAAELGDIIARFSHPHQLMSYAGLVPREYSSGNSRWQGKITKAGNAHIRRVLVECAWNCRHAPAVRRSLRERLNGISPEIQEISWKAQHRLHKTYKRMMAKGKNKNIVIVALARELLGFIWAIAKQMKDQKELKEKP